MTGVAGSRILVTGSSGLLGAAVVAELASAGYTVTGLDRREGAAEIFHRDDLSSVGRLAEIMSGMSGVVHCAAIPNPHAAPEEVIYATNVMTTANVLLAAERAGVSRVIYASSQSALGFAYAPEIVTPDALPIDEMHMCRPLEAYGLSKLVGEKFCAMVSARSSVITLALRFPVIWAVKNFDLHIRRRLDDPVQAAKSQWAYVDLRDACRACRIAIGVQTDFRHRIYNIGAFWPFDMRDPSNTLIRAYGVVSATDAEFVPGDAVFAPARALSELKFKSRWRWHRNHVEDSWNN